MPTRAPRACPAWPCPGAWPCPDHPATWSEGQRGYRRPPGSDQLTRYVLGRDPVCRLCLRAVSVEVHHVIPRDNSSAIGVCAACHKQATAGQAAQAHRLARP